MKELSIEEKAKRYDEVIKVATDIKAGTASYITDGTPVIDAIFPELKESEDERMRNAAINACKYMVDNFENSTKQYEDAIAWLEKQGEQKLVEGIERKYNPCYNMSFEEAQEYISNRGFDIPWTDYDVFVDFRYVTQTVANILRWADDNPRQNPAWSEEDEDILNTIINHFKVDVECTDEDDMVRWLKSLKPQSQWKPSEEQMDALHYVTNFDYGGHKATLVSLYEQLKKLKG